MSSKLCLSVCRYLSVCLSVCLSVSHSLTHSLTHSFIHSLTHSLSVCMKRPSFSLNNKGWYGMYVRRSRRWANAQNVNYTPNLTGEKHTIPTLADQTHIQLTCQRRKTQFIFKTSLPVFFPFNTEESAYLQKACGDTRFTLGIIFLSNTLATYK